MALHRSNSGVAVRRLASPLYRRTATPPLPGERVVIRSQIMNDLPTVAEAIATLAHSGQYRRDGITPYIEHPRSVVRRVDDDPLVIATAWLHDVIEDTVTTAEDLAKQGIPPQVVQAVLLLTKTASTSYTGYLDRVASNDLARRVKVADMLSNLADGPTNRQIRKYAAGLLKLVPTDDG